MKYLENQPARVLQHALRLKIATVFVALIVTLSGCASLGGGFNLISIDDEWQMGRQIETELNQKLTLVNDRTTQQYINQIGQRIVAQTNMSHLPWSFHVVADESVNAFNTPGGNVYVHTGLIREASNVAELAGVIAHEVAHGVARHGTKQMSKAYGINIGAGILLGGNPGLVEQIAAQIAAGGAMAKFSRDDEREADRLGVRFLHQAGYNPMGLANFFEKLMAREKGSPGALGQFFATHPMTQERIDQTRRHASQLGSSGTTSDGQLASVQQRVSRY